MSSRFALELGGSWFEQQVAADLLRRFPNSVALHNLELHSDYLSLLKARDVTTQIDIVFFTSFGFYIIEAKKWGIEINGNRNDRIWQGKANARDFISNISPVFQNLTHLRALKNLLRKNHYYDIPEFQSCVCVPNGTNIISDCREVMAFSSMIYKMQYDQLQFNGREHPELDVKKWSEAVADCIRKDAVKRGRR